MTSKHEWMTIDGNEAVAYVAYRINEVICIYPITPASAMGEWSDEWAANGKHNIWNTTPSVIEMQAEGGAAGALHGSLQNGAISTTFTSSQGLLLMVPNMYKIAGELTPAVIYVAARSIAAQALSIFGDHADVMAVRGTGFGILAANSVQEAHDLALIVQAATFKSRIPFIHFMDGFRTSHEVGKIALIPDAVMREMLDENDIIAHRGRALSPEHPSIRGTAQNPDVFFQARETVNRYYDRCPETVQACMDRFATLTGRQYRLFDYVGAPDAERVVVMMGSGAETTHETVDYLNTKGEKVGLLKVRLYRPFDQRSFCQALPATAKTLAVLDRTKEPGSAGEPLYLDCVNALECGGHQGWLKGTRPTVIGGRYGLSSKEFNPAMVKAVYTEMQAKAPRNGFTVGITDDVTNLSLTVDRSFSIEGPEVKRAMFYGLGADGTVGANKNSIKIIGENTPNFAQGYFVYDSKKSGAMTVSHLRFSPKPIRSTYLIDKAEFVGCHQTQFLRRFDLIEHLIPGGVLLLNVPWAKDQVMANLPATCQKKIRDKKVRLFAIDATALARELGLGNRINTILQVCYFGISGVLPRDEAIAAIKHSIEKTYGKKGDAVVQQNLEAVDRTLSALFEVSTDHSTGAAPEVTPLIPASAPAFIREVVGEIIAGRGDELPVSKFPADGTYPMGTTAWEKRNIALDLPQWNPELCIQCSKCTTVCPHAAIRHKVYDEGKLSGAPETFRSKQTKDRDWAGMHYTIQVAPEDCTGCGLCAAVCPGKDKVNKDNKALTMKPKTERFAAEQRNFAFFLELPELDRSRIKPDLLKQQQVQQPLFEFSGACAGCGETPYLKMLTQLYGDRMVVANATGCSSIYGGNLPTTPWAANREGRGPAWANSLFEDNAEFGLGFRMAIDKQTEHARELLKDLAPRLGDTVVSALLESPQDDEAGIIAQRTRVAELKKTLASLATFESKRLYSLADFLVKRCVWIVGGDGWAYDIGYGGLDHVIASGRDVNILVMDTEVYSNTGGQMSKASPLGAVAKFAMGGKRTPKKDLGMMAMSYGTAYVAQVAFGARDAHTLKALVEAERFRGPSLVIAYCHCIAHGIDMVEGLDHQKAAVESGQWLLYRYNPDNLAQGKPALKLDTTELKVPVAEYFRLENRFNMLQKERPEIATKLFAQAQKDIENRYRFYRHLEQFGTQG